MTSACPNLEFLGATICLAQEDLKLETAVLISSLMQTQNPDIDAFHLQVRDGHLDCLGQDAAWINSLPVCKSRTLKFSARTANQTVRTSC